MKHKLLTAVLTAAGMLVLILDAKTALSGTAEGISLCLQTVIPSLFPFLLLSILLTGIMKETAILSCKPLARLLKIPANAVSIFLVGLLGGYPAGAQSIALACRNSQLSTNVGKRMLLFCNNAGPAFLFGIGVVVFDEIWPCFLLWGIQILSSILVAMFTPSVDASQFSNSSSAPISISAAMKRAVESMALICGWVILFRVLLTFLQRWFFWLLPLWAQISISGLLELTNGCCALTQIPKQGARLLMFGVFSGFGGVCVQLQTLSVTEGISVLKEIMSGKLLQAFFCMLLGSAAQCLFAPYERFILPFPVLIGCSVVTVVFILAGKKQKKGVAFRRKLVYNGENPT